ncbi:hypothetical protein HIM_07643 [Hirsutella minnesotensis 3608]|uniref:Uncharacterized protein n=1 Tax=Hirsutella minnesotensis 3608 TaxID=1043627 RepID=A0A0F7ZMZ9_9HYPO|nr:hypothetical protein HIM_07643 [Hirsutella minnesotensis 3608]
MKRFTTSLSSPSLPHDAPPQSTSNGAARTGSKTADIPLVSRASRTLSWSSDASSTRARSLASSLSSSFRKPTGPWIRPAPKVNVHTTCGRHTDQFFFGGPSLTELARSIIKKKS